MLSKHFLLGRLQAAQPELALTQTQVDADAIAAVAMGYRYRRAAAAERIKYRAARRREGADERLAEGLGVRGFVFVRGIVAHLSTARVGVEQVAWVCQNGRHFL